MIAGQRVLKYLLYKTHEHKLDKKKCILKKVDLNSMELWGI